MVSTVCERARPFERYGASLAGSAVGTEDEGANGEAARRREKNPRERGDDGAALREFAAASDVEGLDVEALS